MGKISYILVSCIILFLLSVNASAGSYDLEGTDPTGDVKDLEDGGNFTSNYPELDIISAKVEEDGNNVVFTLQVLGEIVPNNSSIRYVFRIQSEDTSDYVDLFFKNPYLSYVYRQKPYLKVDCEYELNADTVVITAPKTAFEDVITPWDVTAKAKVYTSKDVIIDQLALSYETDEDDTGGVDDANGSTDDIPSFEAITIIIGLFMAVLIILAIIFIFWNRKSGSK